MQQNRTHSRSGLRARSALVASESCGMILQQGITGKTLQLHFRKHLTISDSYSAMSHDPRLNRRARFDRLPYDCVSDAPEGRLFSTDRLTKDLLKHAFRIFVVIAS